MSLKLDKELEQSGTRFLLFPQPRFLPGSEPEVITISVSPDKIMHGPADDRFFVVDAINKRPYNQFNRPQYTGEKREPSKPGSHGHFDKIDIDSRDFYCATMYATVRRVLDIWEDYFGSFIPWHFEGDFARMELIPLIEWNNAQSGYGFLEFGYASNGMGGIDKTKPYCENFDVLAHELGHSIIFSKVGFPINPNDRGIDFGGMHESGGDLIAIISLLHFNTVVDKLLSYTKGNLFTVNELTRVGELSNSRQIRLAFNSYRMSDVGDEPHDRSQPLTGAIFDILVEVFQSNLVEKGLITEDLAERSTQNPTNDGVDLEKIQEEFGEAYLNKEAEFKISLLEARDYLGALLAKMWNEIDPNFLSYYVILQSLVRNDRIISGGKYSQIIRECFAWREIQVPSNSIYLKSFSIADCHSHRSYVNCLEPEHRLFRPIEYYAIKCRLNNRYYLIPQNCGIGDDCFVEEAGSRAKCILWLKLNAKSWTEKTC